MSVATSLCNQPGSYRRVDALTMFRLLLLILFLVLTLGLPFMLFAGRFDLLLAGDAAVAQLREYGAWAWLVAIGLLLSDLLLPVPTSAILAALGILYGPLVGGAVGVAGLFTGGLLGYVACRLFGRKLAERLAGSAGLNQAERLFARAGGWIVAFSRWLPLLPEVISCLAGLVKMPVATFCAALLCGALPVAYAYAVLGHLGAGNPTVTLLASAAAPLVLWALFGPLIKRWSGAGSESENSG